nr:hypothetical protein [Tanacetum cinerariifolium]
MADGFPIESLAVDFDSDRLQDQMKGRYGEEESIDVRVGKACSSWGCSGLFGELRLRQKRDEEKLLLLKRISTGGVVTVSGAGKLRSGCAVGLNMASKVKSGFPGLALLPKWDKGMGFWGEACNCCCCGSIINDSLEIVPVVYSDFGMGCGPWFRHYGLWTMVSALWFNLQKASEQHSYTRGGATEGAR